MIVNMITSKEIEDYYDHPSYPDGPVKQHFSTGVLGTQIQQTKLIFIHRYSDWYKHSTRDQ